MKLVEYSKCPGIFVFIVSLKVRLCTMTVVAVLTCHFHFLINWAGGKKADLRSIDSNENTK